MDVVMSSIPVSGEIYFDFPKSQSSGLPDLSSIIF
jgi:hypothetical protein